MIGAPTTRRFPSWPSSGSTAIGRFKDGLLFCGDSPGHGVDINESLAAKFPYKPAYLPVARLEDGTLWNW